jgi:hypothetical protein
MKMQREFLLAQRQALQARRARRRHELCYYTALLRRRSEGSETGSVVFRRQLNRRLQAHVGQFKPDLYSITLGKSEQLYYLYFFQ